MFGFGWVRPHSGDFFSREYMSVLLFLVGFLEKRTKSAKSGNSQGPTSWHRDPMQQRRSTPRRGMSTPQRG